MTARLLKAFPRGGGTFQIEPDASSASYFLAAGFLLPSDETFVLSGRSHRTSSLKQIDIEDEALKLHVSTGRPLDECGAFIARHAITTRVTVRAGPTTDWQVDAAFARFLPLLQRTPLAGQRPIGSISRLTDLGDFFFEGTHYRRLLVESVSRRTDLGDSIMTAVVLAPFSHQPLRFTDLARLRVQECERVAALRTELTRCGAKVIEEGDTLTVFPSQLHGAEIETHGDHRMAMCFAILGLKVAGIRVNNASCVKKTFPSFYQKLAAPPPAGLGARILDAKSGRRLKGAELFAE
jgi:3-phosphoshikimate 1-carboxyvinyltransferase